MGAPVQPRLQGMDHEAYYESRVPRAARIKALSHAGLGALPDGYFDLIYLDAGHTYDDVSRDLEVSARKLSADGLIVCNDYTPFDQTDGVAGGPYGVIQAVNEFVASGGWEVFGFALEKHGFHDIALRRHQ